MSLSPIQKALKERLGPITRLLDNSFQATITFDKDFPGFAGHFPGNPIVPGICEISLVELLAKLATGDDSLRTKQITHVKFRSPLLPGDCATFTFTIRTTTDNHTAIHATASTPQNKNLATIKITCAATRRAVRTPDGETEMGIKS